MLSITILGEEIDVQIVAIVLIVEEEVGLTQDLGVGMDPQ